MSFKWNGATIAARELTIGDDETISNLAALVTSDKSGFYLVKHARFAEFQIGAVIEGEWPLPQVSETDSHEAVAAAYEAWRGLPRRFGGFWQKELSGVESGAKNE